ncbi:GAF and ANTAR domain-containing protein [Mycolicibacterium cosmeticum]|uniref:Response regulator receiver/ANTAR domain-containing protein n=1 Tax=Mycolicibacterium cosmeticum TaxID=258533 RepID=W9BKI3_MYCCO|nr:GAF and ANTAR domain-containing protein [Mycolicibacterium cosmeticum]CDO07950.1 response regulator receiver/ANTAR domain-containing protein [Mycolicibacterium cosmeticum]
MTHSYDDAIAAAMADLAATAADGRKPVAETLSELTEAAVAMIDGVDCAGILVIENGEFNSVAATSDVARMLDHAQRETGEGPCVDAAERDVIVRCNDLRHDGRWPRFSEIAIAEGVLSVMSFRLYTVGVDSGALNLFGFGTGSFTAEPEALGAMLATHAAVALVAVNRQQQFESALASRDLIGQAKGILMERFDVDAVRAFELLRRVSQESNTPVKEIAARLTERKPLDSAGPV